MKLIIKSLIALVIDLAAAWMLMDGLSGLGVSAGFGSCYLLAVGVSLAVTSATFDSKDL